ncbi:MAG: biotin synthase BioB [Ruminococcus sp.]|nr:biotin synthase BioB [Ruminococcus sp.]
MTDLKMLADEIIAGRRLQKGDKELSYLTVADIGKVKEGADTLRRKLCGEHIDLCSIINGKSGKCQENCKFCAQSAHNCTGIEEYGFLEESEILKECLHNDSKGVHRFAIVTAGRTLKGNDFEKALSAFRTMKEKTGIALCASLGLLSEEQFRRLYEAGVRRYHCNIETSRRFFPEICTTHTFDDKLKCIARAKKAGFQVCSGGIIGMGETWEDRIDMAFTLRELGVSSVPINALMPIPGTPLENNERLTAEDVIRTVAIFRYIIPDVYIRIAAGRGLVPDSGRDIFLAGANATITGDMLTTTGSDIDSDMAMLKDMGFDITREN